MLAMSVGDNRRSVSELGLRRDERGVEEDKTRDRSGEVGKDELETRLTARASRVWKFSVRAVPGRGDSASIPILNQLGGVAT